MDYVFCPVCGARLSSKVVGDEGSVPFCEDCCTPFLDLAKPSILALALNDNHEVALLRQPHVSETNWVLVAGFNQAGETAEETVAREVHEETGLSVKESLYIASYHHHQNSLLMLGFLARVEGVLSAVSAEVAEVRWVPFDEVPQFLRGGSTALRHYQNERVALGRQC